MDPWSIAGLGTLVAAVATAIYTLSKRRPDVAKVYIEASTELVVTQSTVLRDTTEAYKSMQDRVELMEKNFAAQEERHRETSYELEEVHRELAKMHEEMALLTESRDHAREALENERLQRRLLQKRVELLEDTLRRHDIPVPNGDILGEEG